MLLYVVAEMFEVDDEMLLDAVGGGCGADHSRRWPLVSRFRSIHWVSLKGDFAFSARRFETPQRME